MDALQKSHHTPTTTAERQQAMCSPNSLDQITTVPAERFRRSLGAGNHHIGQHVYNMSQGPSTIMAPTTVEPDKLLSTSMSEHGRRNDGGRMSHRGPEGGRGGGDGEPN